MSQITEIAKGLYASFAQGDVPGVLSALSPSVRWVEAEGGPYGGVSIGPQQVLDRVFMKLGAEWDGFAAVPREFIANEQTVVALGDYTGTYKATAKSFTAPFAHVWKFKDGKVLSFHQHTDTVLFRRPLQ